MDALLTVIVAWLSVNFGLPEIYQHPRVERVSAAEMAEVRYGGLEAGREQRVAADTMGSDDFHALYDDRSQTIYLPEGWSGRRPADASFLVHELVHHLQNMAGLAYACPGEREKPAYRAQARWLEQFGTSLADEFELDPMTVLVRTNCMR